MKSPHQKKWLEGQNGKLAYFSCQDWPGRPTVVFLHGLSANHTTWDMAADELKNMSVNCLLLDLRGHGFSDKRKQRSLYKFPVLARDLKAVLDQEGLSSVILVGYSFGGVIALDFAAQYPEMVQGLALVSTNYVSPYQHKYLGLAIPLLCAGLEVLAWLFLWQSRRKYFYFDQNKAGGYWQSTFSGFTTMPISINLWMLAEYFKINYQEQLTKIICPTLLVKSKSDLFFSDAEAQEMAEAIKDSAIVAVEENTHFLASRYREKIALAIAAFLQRHKLI